MKLNLSRTVLSTLAACALIGHTNAATPERPYYVHTEGGDITESIKGYQGLLTEEEDRGNKAQSYVKDTSNAATITGSFNMDTRLIIREGTLTVSGPPLPNNAMEMEIS